MKWERKHSRTVRRFALFPIRVGDEYRWLETVYIQQHLAWDGICISWVNARFADKKQWKEWRKK